MGAKSHEYSARTTGVFNPNTRVLNFDDDEGNDTADEDAVKQVVVAPDVPVLQQPESPAYAVHMPELRQPKCPVRSIWLRLPRPDNVQDEPEEERAARIAEKHLEELIWQDVIISDTVAPYEVPLVTDAEY